MTDVPQCYGGPVTLVGGGPLDLATLTQARAHAPVLIAADQAADRLDRWGLLPDLLVGDMDSIGDLQAWKNRPVRILHLREQETADFEKCLYATQAPLYLGCGFTGGRIDHTLAVFHALLRYDDRKVVLIGEAEVMTLVPPARVLRIAVGRGARVSVFPLLETTGLHSTGLRWPVRGLTMAPGRQIGTSNIAEAETVEVAFDRPGALLMLEREALSGLIAALGD